MKKLLFVSLALATALATSPAAKADTFNITLGGPNLTGVGQITGSSIGGGQFSITSGTITLTSLSGLGGSVQSTAPAGPTIVGSYTTTVTKSGNTATWTADFGGGINATMSYTNILSFPLQPYVDGTGFGFALSDGEMLNIWSDGNNYYYNIWTNVFPTAENNMGWLVSPFEGEGGLPVTISLQDIGEITPEPSSLLLLGTGLLLMAGFLFKKAKPGMVQSL